MAEGLASARADAAVEKMEKQRLTKENKDLEKELAVHDRTGDRRVIQLEKQVKALH